MKKIVYLASLGLIGISAFVVYLACLPYFSQISKEKGEVHIKPINLKNVECLKDYKTIGNKALVCFVEYRSIQGLANRIILGVFDGLKGQLPIKPTSLFLDCGGLAAPIELGKIAGYEFREGEGYRPLGDAYRAFLTKVSQMQQNSATKKKAVVK